MPLRRLASFVFRHPGGTVVALAAAGVWGAVAMNALAFQPGPHPAPLLARGDAIGAPGQSGNPADRLADAREAERQRLTEEQREIVREVQQLLSERGFYDGEIDGLSGPMTAEAIRAFEERAGLDVTGEPRAALLAKIELSPHHASRPDEEETASQEVDDAEDDRPTAAAEPPVEPSITTLSEADIALSSPEPDPAPPSDGDPQVEAVQRVLADLGYAPGRIDGQLGPQTEEAIRGFQRDRGLEPNGELNAELLRELSAVSGQSLG
jgi:peptidoglycan hydrolase-like protein with peptidoglycan-binding domain